MLASRSEEKLAAVKQELLALGGGGRVEYCATDVTRKEDIEALIHKTAEMFGQIDILVNNSGGPPSGSFESLTDEDWERAFELNVLSYVRLIRGALPYMKESGGHIVNIASTSVNSRFRVWCCPTRSVPACLGWRRRYLRSWLHTVF